MARATAISIKRRTAIDIRMIIKWEKRLTIKSPRSPFRISFRGIEIARGIHYRPQIGARARARERADFSLVKRAHTYTRFQSHAHVTSPSKDRAQFTKQLRKRQTFFYCTSRHIKAPPSSLTDVVINPSDTLVCFKSLTFRGRHATTIDVGSCPPSLPSAVGSSPRTLTLL